MRSLSFRYRARPRVLVGLRTYASLAAVIAGASALGCGPGGPGEPDASVQAKEAVAVELWDGVPPLVSKTEDLALELRPQAGPKPPPSVSERIELPFPPPSPAEDAAPVVEPGALEVLRYGPTGAQGAIDSLTAVFDQPMVPLAAIDDLRDEEVPLVIEPAVPGQFRWLGTEALAFEASGRFPFSTTYSVKVQAGTTSTLGGALAEELAWSFSTPTLALESSYPPADAEDALPGGAVVLRFNQAIRGEEMLAAGLELRAGRERIALKAIPESAWGSLEGGAKLATSGLSEAVKARVLVVQPTQALRPNTRYVLQIPGGAFGEGPDAAKAQTLKFSTYPPLRVTGTVCAPEGCSPRRGVHLRTTTPLRADDTVAELVKVSPAVEGLTVTAGHGLQLAGRFEGEAKYTVTIQPGLKDIHGQTMAKAYTGVIKTSPYGAELALVDSVNDPVVIERSSVKSLPFKVAGVGNVEFRSRALSRDELGEFLGRRWFEVEAGWPRDMPPATNLETILTPTSKRAPQRVSLDLSGLMEPGKVLYVAGRTAHFQRWGHQQRLGVSHLVEVTDLGITAALDRVGGTALLTSIDSGEPLAGVLLQLRHRTQAQPLWMGTSDERGLVELDFVGELGGDHFLFAKRGDEVAFLPLARDVSSTWWGREPSDHEPRAFIYSDKQPYKPGETAHLAGIVRREQAGPLGEVTLWREGATASYKVTSPRGEEIAVGETTLSAFGTFSIDVSIPEGADLGDYGINLEFPGGLFGTERAFFHSIAVESYRAPEFEVKVEREEEAPLVFGDALSAEVHGSYLHGAPLVGGSVSYTVRRQASGFVPPGPENRSFSFGVQSRPVWGGMGDWGRWGPPWGGAGTLVAAGTGSLDARGVFVVEHVVKAKEPELGADEGEGIAPLRAPTAPAKQAERELPPSAASYTIEASVTDRNRQMIAGRETYVVHPALRYIGLRSDREVYREGERARVQAVVVDLDGARIPEVPLSIELIREETRRTAIERDGQWVYDYSTEEIEAGGCSPISGGAPASCEFDLSKAGTYSVRASVRDEAGRTQESRRTFYVHGEDGVIWAQDQRRIDLVADKRSYEPGETATLLVRAPFDHARGLLVIERDGIAETRPLEVRGGAATVEIKLRESMIPNLHVAAVLDRGRIDVPGAPAGQDLGRPAHAFGSLELELSSASKRIVVDLEPDREEFAPKETLRLRLRTKTRDGDPLPAAVALMVVDEGVLSLMGYETPDPLSFFHRQRGAGARVFDLRAYLLRRQVPDELGVEPNKVPPPEAVDLATRARPGAPQPDEPLGYGGGDYGGTLAADGDGIAAYAMSAEQDNTGAGQVALRTLFASTAYFNPEVLTDEGGEAVVEIPMPENLSAFRVMAVAVDPKTADRFGSADTRVRVRKPIMIRPSLPRFANYGDVFEAAVMVDNQTASPQSIEVGARGLGVSIRGDGRSTVQIPAGESREVRLPMSADEVGQARIQFAALAEGGRDATEVTFPIQVPATRQAFATYGVTESSVAQLLKAPLDALPGFGGLELSLSSTALGGLEDATRFLLDYDYECTEQTASRLLPIFVLGPILEGFAIAGGADLERRTAIARSGIKRLLGRQNHDGGFRLWDTAGRSWPYVSAWVTFALLEGKEAGIAVDERSVTRALSYLGNYLSRAEESRYGRTYDWTSRAFALWLLSRQGRGAEHFDEVWSHRADLPLYARAWMLSAAHRYKRVALAERLRAEITALATEDAKVARFVEGRSEASAEGLRMLMHSNVQTDAIALMALLEVSPEDPLLPKVMAGIMADRDPRAGGRWSTTHANGWALLAANRYYRTVEKTVPEFVARVFLGDEFAGEQTFSGRSLAVTEQSVPMRKLQESPERVLTLAKEGAGKLYYRLGLRYAPADLTMDAEDQGFVVYRGYEAVAQGEDPADPTDVQQQSDGSWAIKAGSMVRVNLTLVARDRASYVVVDDPLPAGLEGQNSRFQTALQDVDASLGGGRAAEDGQADRWWNRWWSWDHVELRDDRLLLFADSLPAGVYTYSYLAQATTIGEFQLPPVHAEGMYTPERFGHSASSIVRVVE